MTWTTLLAIAYGAIVGAWIARTLARRCAVNEHRHGFIAGLDHGVRNHARWINARHLTPFQVNGFTLECPHCGTISANIIPARDEYVACQECHQRIPTPLAPEPMEVPHG